MSDPNDQRWKEIKKILTSAIPEQAKTRRIAELLAKKPDPDDPVVLAGGVTLSELDEAIELGRELAQLRAKLAAILHSLPVIVAEIESASTRVEIGINTQENLGIRGYGSLQVAREHLKSALDTVQALDLVLREPATGGSPQSNPEGGAQ